MMPSQAQALTARFYKWEVRGRGWHTCQVPVDIEPPFHPFTRHVPPPAAVIDDSKRPTLLSSIADIFRGTPEEPQPEVDAAYEIPEATPFLFTCDEELIVYRVALPKEHKLKVDDMEQLLLMLSYTDYPISFEIVGTGTAIAMQLACRKPDATHVYAQVQAYFPVAVITKYDKGVDILLDDTPTCVIDFGLAEEFMRPLCVAGDVDHDPFSGLFGTLEHLQKGECGVIQVLFKGTINPWAESIMRSVCDSTGSSFFADAPDMPKYAEQKVSAPLFGVCIRVVGQGRTAEQSMEIARNIGLAVIRLTSSKGNSLQALSQDAYPVADMIDDTFLRQSCRTGMLLNSRELATLVHFPTSEIASKKLERDIRKTKSAPENTTGHSFVLGTNPHQGSQDTVSVPAALRLRHTHIIGATGTGKSTLLLSMIAQDMQQGNGCAVLDPHGDLIEGILAYIPASRIDDVVVIDPADGEYPVGFNILSAHSEIEKDILSSDLVAAFRRLSTSWGDQMNSVFANAILAFLESPEGGTLLDLRRFLVEKGFRDAYLKSVSDPHIVYYWQHEYPLLKSSSIGSILTRLDTFLRPKLIRNMVAQRKGLDFESILDTRKILLVKLSQGLIGAENSFLLGTFFVSKIYQAAMARQAKSAGDRSDFFMYVDEFQNFITPSMSHILSGARKYHLGLILAHQDMQQLQKYDTELASSVVVNAGTRICFRLGDTDAKRFASGFSYFDAADLENLRIGEAITRIEQPNMDFNLATLPLPEVEKDTAALVRNAAIEKSREKYGTPRALVEQGTEYARTVKQEQQDIAKEEVVERAQETIVEPQAALQPISDSDIPKIRIAKKAETQHRYLQTLIKKMAEARGYKVLIEEPTPDGKGRVDVSLERSGKRIACEVSVTTSDTWETHNVEKCLAAGYDTVIVCSDNAKNLGKIRRQIEGKLDAANRAKVLTLDSTELTHYFDRQIIEESNTEMVVRGYRVKVEYDVPDNDEQEHTQRHIVRAVADSMKKKK